MVQLHDWRWMLAVWAVGSVRTIDLNSYKVAFKYGGLRVARLIQWYVAYPRAGFTRESSKSECFFFFLMKSHCIISIILCWLKQSQAHPDLRRGNIHSASYWREYKNIWGHFLKPSHKLTHIVCYSASSSLMVYVSWLLISVTLLCFVPVQRCSWGRVFAEEGHKISVYISSKPFAEFVISVLHSYYL